MSESYPTVEVRARAEWRRWLEDHHATSPGVWLVTFKAGSGGPHVVYGEVVEEALCFGWVDSRPRTVDAERSALLVTPRAPRSRRSRRNKERVARLTEAGVMAPAGLAAVERARASGAWTALDDVEDLVEPDDLRAALAADPAARENWTGFPPSVRRGILEWILDAKRPETRGKRIRVTVEEAAAGRRANQWRRPPGG